MYRYRRYGIKPIEPKCTSLLTKAQIKLYRAQAEKMRELEPGRLSNTTTDELIKNGAKQMQKDNFKIAIEGVKEL